MSQVHTKLLYNALLVFFYCSYVRTQGQIGNKCKLNNGSPGTCKLVTQCPIAIEQNKLGIPPKICGRYYNEPIVCCTEEQVGSQWNSPNAYPDTVGIPTGPSKGKSEQKCMEYSRRLLVHVVEAIPLVINPESITSEVPKCDYNSIPLIVGGSPAEPGEFPHMALLGYRNIDNEIDWNCGGTLISENFVLTAAHCSHTRLGPPTVVRLGELILSRDDDNSEPVNIDVERIFKHPAYKPPKKYNDIALIKLARSAQFNRFVRPACLYTKPNIEQTKTIATGWGRVEFGGQSSDSLQKVALDVVENGKCSASYQANHREIPNGIQPTMMCAGTQEGGKDTCQGDSGGPLQITAENNQCLFYIVGVTSFGKGCGTGAIPAVYTRVSEYVQWIENIVWP